MIKEINESLEPLTHQLINHSLYNKLHTPQQLRIFMEHHVFAVWDHMSLITALQERLTRTTNPWLPVGDPESRYLIYEMILAKETDINIQGRHQSFFEMYLDAMDAAGASRNKIENFLSQVNHGTDIFLIIAASELPISIKQFLKNTFEIVYSNEPHQIASALTFGRKGLIPAGLSTMIEKIQKNFPQDDLSLFKYYFDRHLQLEKDKHESMDFKLLTNLCGKKKDKWTAVKENAETALKSRIELWNGIEQEIEAKTKMEYA